MQEAVRIEKDAKKKDPLDFALWKKSKGDEPSWDYWRGGRPGWHIECSCMSLKYLKCQTLDIHAGGRDLIFPHHENEIAQAEALTGKPLAKYWIHHGLLTINGQKMAKSLGNFITVDEAVNKYHLDDLKLFFLFSHYASDIDFSDDKIEDAHQAMQRFDILFWKAYDIVKGKEVEPVEAEFVKVQKDNFLVAMDDDFNTPKALSFLFELVSETNKFIDEGKKDKKYFGIIFHAVNTIEDLARNIFGLFLKEKEYHLTEELEELIEARRLARSQKDFKKSDDLRELLKQKGISVEDKKDGQAWRWI